MGSATPRAAGAICAARTHFSVSLIKKVEQGSVPPSAAFVVMCAQALQVKPSYLYGTDERELAAQPAVEAAGIAELRAALDGFDDPRPEGAPLTLPEAVRRLESIAKDIYQLRYVAAAWALPGVLPHLYLLAGRSGVAGEQARAALHDAYRLTASVAGQFRQADLAAIASERHVAIAPLTGDPVRAAISAYHRASRHLQSGNYPLGLRVVDAGHLNRQARELAGRDVRRGLEDHLTFVLAGRNGDLVRAGRRCVDRLDGDR